MKRATTRAALASCKPDFLHRLVQAAVLGVCLFRLGAESGDYVAQCCKRLINVAGFVDSLRILLGLRDSLTASQVDEAELRDELVVICLILHVLRQEECVDIFTFHIQLDLKDGVASRARCVARRLRHFLAHEAI